MSDFDLDEVTGVITVKQELNFEVISDYTFTVFARDISTSPLQTSVGVRYNITHLHVYIPVNCEYV